MSGYLIHHGIKGQQWGVQNGPPYPLDKSISTGKSLKREYRKDKAELKHSAGSFSNSHRMHRIASDMLFEDLQNKSEDERWKRLLMMSLSLGAEEMQEQSKYAAKVDDFIDKYGKESFDKVSRSKIVKEAEKAFLENTKPKDNGKRYDTIVKHGR